MKLVVVSTKAKILLLSYLPLAVENLGEANFFYLNGLGK